MEIGLEVGGLLARDAVDEIERDVVNSGITKSVDGASDVVRLGNTAERRSSSGRNDWAPIETRVTPRRASRAASSGVTVSGLASTVSSPAAGSAASRRSSAPAR